MNKRVSLNESALIEYLDECEEMLGNFSKNLSQIENGRNDTEIFAAIYRDMHTIKGSSQLFGYTLVSKLAHAMETCLDPVRKGQMESTSYLIDQLYHGADTITKLIKGIRDNGKETDLGNVVNSIVTQLIQISERGLADIKNDLVFSDKQPFIDLEGEISHTSLPSETIPQEDISMNTNIFVSSTENYSSTSSSEAVTNNKNTLETTHSETIRVHVAILDNLMNLVGELVLIRNQFLQHDTAHEVDTEFTKIIKRLNILTAELQNEVMKTRMQPIGNILSQYNRVVRDLGRELNKNIKLIIEGSETELDKTIIEAVKDPLTHIVRNSIDHGIEPLHERQMYNKEETGILRIKAHHESGQVIIEISDDGRGLDTSFIGRKAIEKGLITQEDLNRMSEKEIQFLIFTPGFTTASSVSNISGRGVGMDVVKTNIERIGGTIDVHSTAGHGTNIQLKIPLTLAIVPALIIRSDNHRFAIPQSKLVELVRVTADGSSNEFIEYLQGCPVLRIRGKILPLLKLTEVLATPDTPSSHKEDEMTNVVILNADGFQYGLVVDEIEDTADIVVKALPSFLKDLRHFSGATIMGDGAVALTLDVLGLSVTARLPNESYEQHSKYDGTDSNHKKRHFSDNAEFLLVDIGASKNYAIPLAVVSRLEEFSNEDIEFSGEQAVVNYRGSLLPIFNLPEFLHLPHNRSHNSEHQKHSIVVIRRGDTYYGIKVLGIHDVIELPAHINQHIKDRPGILGTTIFNDHALVVVDILGVIDSFKTKINHSSPTDNVPPNNAPAPIEHHKSGRILVAEDSSFFRGYVKQILEEEGYIVDIACDGLDAWEILQKSKNTQYSLILSDIEMPNLDGHDLVKKIRADSRFAHIPTVALTTRFNKNDIEKGYQSGFTKYLEKLNPENLITAIDQIIMSQHEEDLPSASSL